MSVARVDASDDTRSRSGALWHVTLIAGAGSLFGALLDAGVGPGRSSLGRRNASAALPAPTASRPPKTPPPTEQERDGHSTLAVDAIRAVVDEDDYRAVLYVGEAALPVEQVADIVHTVSQHYPQEEVDGLTYVGRNWL